MTAFYELLPLLADPESGRTWSGRTLPPRAKPCFRLSTIVTMRHASRSRGKSQILGNSQAETKQGDSSPTA